MPVTQPPVHVRLTGNTAGAMATVSSGTLTLAGGDNITLSQNGNAITISGPSPAGGAGLTAGVSNIGNTSGHTTAITGRLVLAGGNNVTLSGSSNGASLTVTISAANETQTVPPIATAVKVDVSTVASTGTLTRFAPEDHQHRGVNSAGASNLGNTAGDTGAGPGRLVLVGSDNVTLSQATNATGSTLSIIGAAGGGGAAFSGGLSNVGNTSGDTGAVTRRLVLAGGNNVTLSGSTDGASATVTVSADLPTLSYWDNHRPANTANVQLGEATLYVMPLAVGEPVFPGRMTVSTLRLNVNGSVSSQTFTVSLSLGLYTVANSTQLSLLNSVSSSWGTGANDANLSQSFAGYRWLTIHSSQWSAPPALSGGRYFLGVWSRNSGTSRTFSFWGHQNLVSTSTRSGVLGAGSSSNTTLGWLPFLGLYSVTFTTGMPVSLAASDLNKLHATANFVPALQFDNVQSIPV